VVVVLLVRVLVLLGQRGHTRRERARALQLDRGGVGEVRLLRDRARRRRERRRRGATVTTVVEVVVAVVVVQEAVVLVAVQKVLFFFRGLRVFF
jgi:hypothetical protein